MKLNLNLNSLNLNEDVMKLIKNAAELHYLIQINICTP